MTLQSFQVFSLLMTVERPEVFVQFPGKHREGQCGSRAEGKGKHSAGRT